MPFPNTVPERVTATIRAEELPKEVAAKFAARPIPGTPYRVTVEVLDESDGERLEALRRGVQIGRQQIAAGQGIAGETVFSRLRAEYVLSSDK